MGFGGVECERVQLKAAVREVMQKSTEIAKRLNLLIQKSSQQDPTETFPECYLLKKVSGIKCVFRRRLMPFVKYAGL